MSDPTTAALTVHIPATIDKALSPNRSRFTHWGTVANAEKALSWATTVGLIEARRNSPDDVPILKPPIRWDLTIYWGKGRKRMDEDNIVASLKRGMIDTVAAQIGIDDKHFTIGTITQDRDPDKQGCMVLTLTGAIAQGEAA